MQRLEVSGAVRSIYGSLGVKRLTAGEINLDETNTRMQNFGEPTAVCQY